MRYIFPVSFYLCIKYTISFGYNTLSLLDTKKVNTRGRISTLEMIMGLFTELYSNWLIRNTFSDSVINKSNQASTLVKMMEVREKDISLVLYNIERHLAATIIDWDKMRQKNTPNKSQRLHLHYKITTWL